MQPATDIHVYNTLGRSLQPFVPNTDGKVGIYVCGPTVQSDPHVGHGRFAVAFDVIVRYLRWRGFDVTYVRNVTDVEDKIIAAAAETGETTEELAARVAERFTEAFESLRVLPPDHEPKATEHIDGMIRIIEQLIDRGLAYPGENGDVYFSVRTLEAYGKLSGRKPDELRAGARVEVDEFKHDPLDFALWKAAKPGEPWWESPWGAGRPGWHIECSAMSAEFLGETFDIHGGGNDLIFPHHENEIAQSEGANGQTFARYWLHSGMVNLGGEKMSKSTGHIIGLLEAIERFGGIAVRLFYLRAHYRSPLEFSEELIGDAKASLDRIGRVLDRTEPGGEPDAGVMARFVEKMDADFATPEALGVLFDAVRDANRALDAGEDASGLVAAVHEIVDILGIRPDSSDLADLAEAVEALAERLGVEAGTEPESTIEALLERRTKARSERDFATSDAIRDGLAEAGIIVEDTPDGARWHRA
ncbi:MAG: cysteine--tRNA ligase [Acidimicrobiia bacterium]|nr:cysteine--tRNA ligase [Acidimicrobiia bacterium]